MTATAGAASWQELKARGRDVVRSEAASFAENDLLSYASAIAFQVLFALVPLALVGLALLGYLHLEEVWTSDLGPRVRERIQPDAFSVLNRTVEQILGEKRLLWLTLGAAFALWKVSSAVRTMISPLNRIYGAEENRSWLRRLAVSLALALAISPLLVAAAGLAELAPRVVERLGGGLAVSVTVFVLRWGVGIALLTLAVWLLIRYAPARSQSFAWAGVGSAFVLVTWIAASVCFGLYATKLADYGSVFSSVASVIVLMTYLYISALALLFGVQLDASLREQAGRRRDG